MVNCCILNSQVVDTSGDEPVLLHKLEPNELLHSVSYYYGLSVQKIKDANGLLGNNTSSLYYIKIPVDIYKGPNTKYQGTFILYQVQENENLFGISEKLHVSLSEIQQFNFVQAHSKLSERYLIVPNRIPNPDKLFHSSINFVGYVAVGFFAGSHWDGSTNINYSINGNIQINNEVEKHPFLLQNSIEAQLGYRHDIGKYFLKNIDRFEFKHQLEYDFYKNLSPFVFASFRSQFFPSWFYDFNDQKILTASLMGPGYTNLALGFLYRGDFYKIDFGLYEIKTTFVLDPKLFHQQDYVFGVPKDKKAIMQHGISLRADLYYEPDSKLKMEVNALMFLNNLSIDFELRSNLSYKVHKYIKITIRSELMYDRDFSEQIQFRNEILTAFSFYK